MDQLEPSGYKEWVIHLANFMLSPFVDGPVRNSFMFNTAIRDHAEVNRIATRFLHYDRDPTSGYQAHCV
jgi:hypothetical protein